MKNAVPIANADPDADRSALPRREPAGFDSGFAASDRSSVHSVYLFYSEKEPKSINAGFAETRPFLCWMKTADSFPVFSYYTNSHLHGRIMHCKTVQTAVKYKKRIRRRDRQKG